MTVLGYVKEDLLILCELTKYQVYSNGKNNDNSFDAFREI